MRPMIFVVDDDLFFRNYISSILRINGFDNIKVFDSGESCIENVGLNPDVIILDHDMKGMSGSDVMRYLKKTKKNIPVLMVSGREEPELISEMIKLGVHKYLKKDEQLLATLKDYFTSNYGTKNLAAI